MIVSCRRGGSHHHHHHHHHHHRRRRSRRRRRRRRRHYHHHHHHHRPRIGRISMPMLNMGPKNKGAPRLKAKAAETRHLMPLLVELVGRYPTKLGEGSFSLVMCCQQLNLFYTTMHDYPRQMGEFGFRALESSISRV